MKLVIKGQVPSGKNNMGIDPRTGRHYPKQRFHDWMLDAQWQLKQQLKKLDYETIREPVSVDINYISSDRRRRDVPGILDALWHLLEKMNVVEDDSLLGGIGHRVNFSFGGIDKKNPCVEILIGEI